MVKGKLVTPLGVRKIIAPTLGKLTGAARSHKAKLVLTKRGKDEPKIVKRVDPRKTSRSSK